MGSAMASNLLKAGHDVTVWNRSPGPTEVLHSLGAKIARTPERAAQGDALHSMLANDQAVREVILDSGLLDAMDRGMLHINHATISMALAKELAAAHAERGIDYVAAPVFGRPDVAAAGKLNILVAGQPGAIARARPLLEVMASKLWPLGAAAERANVANIAGNYMIVSAIESMAEACALVSGHGVTAADFLEIVTNTVFASPVYQVYGKSIAEQHFSPAGFAMALGHKDISLALAAGDAAHIPLPLASVLRDSLLEALAAGDGALDLAALSKVAARRANQSG